MWSTEHDCLGYTHFQAERPGKVTQLWSFHVLAKIRRTFTPREDGIYFTSPKEKHFLGSDLCFWILGIGNADLILLLGPGHPSDFSGAPG